LKTRSRIRITRPIDILSENILAQGFKTVAISRYATDGCVLRDSERRAMERGMRDVLKSDLAGIYD